jgi:transcriptional regulator with XRE-family HTH domain
MVGGSRRKAPKPPENEAPRKGRDGVAQRLRSLREAAGLSQDQFALIAGVSRNAVSQWEAGRTRPATDRLVLIARSLGVAMEDLLSPRAQVRGRLLSAARGLFDDHAADEVTIKLICETSDVRRDVFDATYASRDDLLLDLFHEHEQEKLAEVRRMSPAFGTLSTRLKYLLRSFYMHDLAHRSLLQALLGASWTWDGTLERQMTQHRLETHEIIVATFDDAAAQGQIDSGNFRAASSLLLSAYLLGLRKAVFEGLDADRMITFIEPQIMIILRGFGYRVIPGLAEEQGPTPT